MIRTLHTTLIALVTAASGWISSDAMPAESIDRGSAVVVAADGNPALEQVLAQIRSAVGFDRVGRHPAGLEARGRTHVGGVDMAYSLRFDGDGRALQRFEGPLAMAAAVDGDVVWITDLGGESRVAVDADRETQLLSVHMITQGWLGPASTITVALDESAGTPESIVLRFAPVEGRVGGRIEIDRATNLPSAWSYGIAEVVAGGEKAAGSAAPPAGSSPFASRAVLTDWIEFDGVRVPGRIEIAGEASASSTIRIDALSPAPAWGGADLAMPAQPPPDTRFDSNGAAQIEVVKAPTGHLLVHPLVNGKDVGWFIFDTGAGMSVLTTSVVDELAAEGGAAVFGEVPANGVGGAMASKFCRPRSLSLGPVTVDEPLTVVLDLSFLDQHMGRKVGGLIGHNFLSRVVTKLDAEAPTISLHDPRTFSDDGIAWQPLVISSRLPHVKARFALSPATEGESERVHAGLFRLDTGAAQMTVSMHEPAVRALGMLDGLDATDGKSGGVGGFVAVKRGSLAWIELGGARHVDVPAEFALDARGAFADPFAVGNIGGRLLKPFDLVLDYPNGRIAFVRRVHAVQVIP